MRLSYHAYSRESMSPNLSYGTHSDVKTNQILRSTNYTILHAVGMNLQVIAGFKHSSCGLVRLEKQQL